MPYALPAGRLRLLFTLVWVASLFCKAGFDIRCCANLMPIDIGSKDAQSEAEEELCLRIIKFSMQIPML